MYTPMDPHGVSYIWNNLGGMQGETTSYITIKTMIQIPLGKPNVGKILEVTGKSNLLSNYNYRWLTGNLLVELKYQGLRNRIVERLNFIIPFQGPTPFNAQGFPGVDVKFITARLIGSRNILIEAVVAVTASQQWGLRGGKEVLGEFSREESIYLEKDFPKAEEVLGVNIKFKPFKHQLTGRELKVYGLKEITVLYVGEQFSGDKISSVRKVEPFTETIQLKQEAPAFGPFTIVAKELNSRLVNPRELILEGKFSLVSFLPLSQSNMWGEMMGTVKNLTEMIKGKKENELKLKGTDNITKAELKTKKEIKEIIEQKEELKEAENIQEAEELETVTEISKEEPQKEEKEELGVNSLITEENNVKEINQEAENRFEDGSKEEVEEEKTVQIILTETVTEETPAVVVEEENKKEKEQAVKWEKQKTSRLSSRERMAKHMRKLKGGIKDKSETKSISL